MDRYFAGAERYRSDVYVADYTLKTENRRGVEITVEPPQDDMKYFHLINGARPEPAEYWGVNFEQHTGFFDGARNCECMFTPTHADHRRWVLLVEMKYCRAHNAEANARSAYDQLLTTLEVMERKGVIDRTRAHRVYFNISLPEHGELAPFSSFVFSPDEILELKEQNIFLLGVNTLLIATYAHILTPKVIE